MENENDLLTLLGNRKITYPTDYSPDILETFQN